MSLSQIRSENGPAGIVYFVGFENNCGEFTDDTQMILFIAEAQKTKYRRPGQAKSFY